MRRQHQIDTRPPARQIFDQGPHQRDRVGCDGIIQGLATREIEEGGQKRLHLGHIAQQRRHLRRIVEHRQAKLHPRQRRAQIMADPRQHQGTLFDHPLDPGAHIEKGMACATHLGRTRGVIADDPPLAKGLGRVRQPLDRLELVAQEQIGDPCHEQAKTDHQHQKLMRVRGRYPTARHGQSNIALARVDDDDGATPIADQIDRDQPRHLAAQHGNRLDPGEIIKHTLIAQQITGGYGDVDLQRIGQPARLPLSGGDRIDNQPQIQSQRA